MWLVCMVQSVVKERPMNVEAMEVVEGEEGAAAEGGASAAVTTIEVRGLIPVTPHLFLKLDALLKRG